MDEDMIRALSSPRPLAAEASPEPGGIALLLLPEPAALLDERGRVLAVNARGAGLGTMLSLRPGQGVVAAQPQQTWALRAAVADAARGGGGTAVGLEGAFVLVTPLQEVGPWPDGAVLLRVRLTQAPSDAALQLAESRQVSERLGLTRAEADVGLATMRGLSVAETAQARRVAPSTVRTLLRRAQLKAGARSVRGLSSVLRAVLG